MTAPDARISSSAPSCGVGLRINKNWKVLTGALNYVNIDIKQSEENREDNENTRDDR